MLYSVANRQSDVVSKIRALNRDVQELKNAQYFSGNNLALYRSSATPKTGQSIAPFARKFFTIVFTYDDHPGQYAQLNARAYNQASPFGFLPFTVYASPSNVSTNTTRTWTLEVFNPDLTNTITVTVMASVNCASTGTVAIS